MLEILLFFILGLFLGIIFGLIPGLHPNTIVLLVPIISSINISPISVISFVVSLSITNTIVNFIPTSLFSVPDEGIELSISHLQKFLLSGNSYKAVQFCVLGSVLGILFLILATPFLYFILPLVFNAVKSFIYIPLIFICCLMILSEKRVFVALVCFVFAGIIGLTSSSLGINPIVILFPILSGMFGLSSLLLQLNAKVSITSQLIEPISIKKSHFIESAKGALGGILSGFLPGVGTSQIAAAFNSINSESYLIKIGALNSANILLSLLTLWLISKPRSGAAVFLDSLIKVGFNEFLAIVFVSLSTLFFAVSFTLIMSKFLIKRIHKFKYSLLVLSIVLFTIVMTFLFSGLIGILLLLTCTSLGVYTNLSKINMSVLMAVLIVPVIVFYVI